MGHINSHPSIQKYWLPFLGGALFALAFPAKITPQLFPLSIIAVFFLLNSLSISYGKMETTQPYERSLKSELLSLLCYSLSYAFVGYYWIPYTLNEFGSIPFPLNYVLGSLFSLIIVPQFLVFIVAHHFIKRINFRSSWFVDSVSKRNCFLAFILTLLEYYTPQQFPAHVGHPFLQMAPYVGLAPFFGTPIFSFFGYWLAMSFIGLLRTRTVDFMALIFFTLFMILNIALPLDRGDLETAKKTNLRLVQANIGNFVKTQSEKGKPFAIKEVINEYKKLSLKPSAKKLDIIVWPETAYPHLLNSSLMELRSDFIPKVMRETIRESGAQLFLGGYDKAAGKKVNFFESEYNAAFFFHSDETLNDVYHKAVLIPFGESLPFGPLNPYFAKVVSNIAYFAKGDKYNLFKAENDVTFISAICYEILFSWYIKDYLNSMKENPHFIINLTNDSWYGNTSEPRQHKFLAHWRALEFNLPIVRVTNTGITSVLYPDGSESKQLELFQPNILDIELITPQRAPTLFQKIGFLGVFGIWLGIMLFIMAFTMLTSKKKSGSNEAFF